MTRTREFRFALAVALVFLLVVGAFEVHALTGTSKTRVTAYFDNSNGIFVGDEVRILGIAVGEISAITPEPSRVKIDFWVDTQYQVPAEVKAVILSPSLVTARAIQLTPANGGGPQLPDHAVIPQTHTAVPVEWDDIRTQLQKLTQTLQPTEPGGVSSLGSLVNAVADNVRGQGSNIRDTVIKLSQAISALGDHRGDISATVRNLSTLVTGLSASTDLMKQLNRNLAAVSGLLSDDPDEVGRALSDLNVAAADLRGFVADNREAVGTASEKLASISQALVESRDDIKQTLHISPNTAANFANVYQPAQGGISAVLALNNFSNTVSFLCGAVQAASRLGGDQSAKLCAQYLAPIIKNRQYNFLPIGLNPFVGATARPNEITYSDDRLRPDHVPAPVPVPAPTVATDPAAGLPGIMAPSAGGS